MSVYIAGTGSYLPKKVMTNDELAKMIDTSDEWIVSHTGIRSRHIADQHESCSILGIEAARRALVSAGVAPEDVGLVVLATSSPDYVAFPATACIIQNALGIPNAMAFDVSAGCTGFVTALDIARNMMANDPRPSLVVCSEVMSRIIDWTDRNTCPLFGDGAAAVVLKCGESTSGLRKSYFRSEGSGAGTLYRGGGSKLREDGTSLLTPLYMQGKAVFNFAVKAVEEAVLKVLERNDITADEIKLIVPHQANFRILDAAARRMNIPVEKFFMNIEHIANTSSASIPIALDELVQKGQVVKGDKLVFVAFGAGLVLGGIYVEF